MENQKMRVCSKCERELPATKDYFYEQPFRTGKKGLRGICIECVSVVGKKKYYDNPELAREKVKQYYHEHSAERIQYTKQYHAEHKEEIHKWYTNYTQNGKGGSIHVVARQKRRATQKELAHTFTREEWIECKAYFNNECAYCGMVLQKLHQDHFIPVSKKGTYTVDNIVPACKHCNSSKLDGEAYTWYQKQKFFNLDRWNRIINYINKGDGN